ncbi:MAG TPA: ABC transporter ATP-binding protein [Solirubrobacterales bacterium]|jgi:branched-chain amino acid transport system ATP-binding protein|nr:ABC transporter ATP-binding protein [Solirubrobacterales bacterium]
MGASPDGIVLEARDLRKSFGGVRAVDGCSFAVPRAKISGLIGPNGSGKTTTFNLLTGLTTPDSGDVLYRGETLAGLRPYEIFRKGITRTFQVTRIFREMTVLENMLSVTGLGVPDRVARERAEELIAFVNLTHLSAEYAGRLSYGQQKLLEFVRALMTDPDVILLDEPAAGVNRTLLQHLLDHIHRLQEQGKTILIVEHDMNVIMNYCERIFVMDGGVKIAEGPPAEIRRDERVLEAYFGRRRG